MKYLNSRIFFLGTTMLSMVTIQVFAENEIVTESHEQSSYINMLNNIIKANEKRINTLKRKTELQDDVVLVTQDRSEFPGEPNGPEESREKQSAIIALLDFMHGTHKSNDRNKFTRRILYLPINNAKIIHKNTYPVIEKYQNSKDILSSEERHERDKLNIEVADDAITKEDKLKSKILDTLRTDFRRKGYMNTCNKAAAKACRQACVNAYKGFCRMYSCSRRAKKTFKTECKYSCKSKFKTNKYSDTE